MAPSDKEGAMGFSGLVVGWNRPIPGREAISLELFGQFLGYLESQKAAGGLDSFEPVLLAPHGGDMNGFILIRGEGAKLAALKSSDEFLDLTTRAAYNVDMFGFVDAFLGGELQKQLGRFGQNIAAGGK